MEGYELVITVEVRHVTVKLLLLIYGSLDGRALKARKPISSSARRHSIASYVKCSSIL